LLGSDIYSTKNRV